ncbi:hypothetical protein EVA_16032 [gut metagenome]|uniref:Uncharacterized protein n=1 Tax=gut metagenome TaxID=749906 RepID=J9G8P7_9ZZZZ
MKSRNCVSSAPMTRSAWPLIRMCRPSANSVTTISGTVPPVRW